MLQVSFVWVPLVLLFFDPLKRVLMLECIGKMAGI